MNKTLQYYSILTIENVLETDALVAASQRVQDQVWTWQEGQTLNLQKKPKQLCI